MRVITFDIETENTFDEVGSPNAEDLDISVVCAHDSKTNEMTYYFVEDLNKLWPLIEKADALVGYNSDHFDIPLLNKYYSGDLKKIKSIDLMKTIKESLGRRIKLDDVAEATLGEKKSSHGLQAIIWWRNGEREKVVEYCKQDVNVTRKLYEFMLEKEYVFVPKDNTREKVEVDISSWGKEEEDQGLQTQSLF